MGHLVTGVCSVLPVTSGRDEVYAAVHSRVGDPLLSVDVYLLLQVSFILIVDEFHNGLPAENRNIVQILEMDYSIQAQSIWSIEIIMM